MIILGTKFYGHDSAVYWINTTERSLFAVSTERLTRTKHDITPISVLLNTLPKGEINVVAESFGYYGANSLCYENTASFPADQVTQHFNWQKTNLPSPDTNLRDPAGEHPLLALVRDVQQKKLHDLKAGAPLFVANKNAGKAAMRCFVDPQGELPKLRVEMFDHHLCHAVSAYYSSPYYPHPCAVVTLDGWGDGYGGKTYIFRGDFYQEIGASPISSVQAHAQNADPAVMVSLGILYQNFTVAAGFRALWDEGKVEALAAFGKPVPHLYQDLMKACLIENNGIHISPQRIKPFYDPILLASHANTYGLENLCATIQKFLEDIVVQYINALDLPEDIDCLCLAGGITANVIMNMAIFERTRFKKVFVVPYMGDEGSACGAGILAAKLYGQDVSWIPSHVMPYLGPSYSREEVRTVLQKHSADIIFTDMENEWHAAAAREIAAGRIIAVFQGKMEFGPRALGNRSILANPADPSLRKKINVSIKRRPPWQPFCPSVLESERTRFFENSFSHKHMAIAFRMKPEVAALLPSAVHIDGTARPQFVSPEDNPSYYRLLEEVKKETGFGIVINTSFNLHGRAMVMTPEHAIDDFLDCNLDTLFIEGYRVTRSKAAH